VKVEEEEEENFHNGLSGSRSGAGIVPVLVLGLDRHGGLAVEWVAVGSPISAVLLKIRPELRSAPPRSSRRFHLTGQPVIIILPCGLAPGARVSIL